MSRTGRYYKHSPAFSDDLDKEIMELEKKALMIKKLHNIMNTIKANGLYSESEMQKDCERLEKLNAPEEEKDIIMECWYIRKLANKQLMTETKALMKKLKKELNIKKELET